MKNIIKKIYYIGAFIGLIIGLILGVILGMAIGGCGTISGPGDSECYYYSNFIITGMILGAILGSLGGILITNIIYKIRLRY